MAGTKNGTCSYLYGNLFNFVKLKPPVTIMVLFVAALSVSLFTLALYVQNSDVLDFEASKVYDAMLNKITKLTFCLTNETEQLDHNGIQAELKKFGDTEFVNVSLPVMPVLDMRGNFTYTGYISEIAVIVPYFLVFEEDKHLHSVALHTFLKPASKPAGCNGEKCLSQVKGCVLMQVKRNSIPDEMLKSTCVAADFHSNYTTIFMSVKQSEKNTRSPCTSGLQLSLDRIKPDGVEVYLNAFEKGKVKFRLHIAGYTFFVILLSVLIYAVMKRRAGKSSVPMKILQS